MAAPGAAAPDRQRRLGYRGGRLPHAQPPLGDRGPCLLHCAKITGRRELAARAQAYLREGLDINEDGEFAERSAGNYNQVNDDQMLRLYMATGDRTFLHAAEKNLEMMYCYIDPTDRCSQTTPPPRTWARRSTWTRTIRCT